MKKKKIKVPKIFFLTQILDKDYHLEIINFIEVQKIKKDIIILDNIPNNLTTSFYEKSLFSINSSIMESFGFLTREHERNLSVILSEYKTYREINKNAAIYLNKEI